jgi:hypothetical protein
MTSAGGDSLRLVNAEALSAGNKNGIGDERGMIDACEKCLRRSWLLAMLSARLGYQARDRGRLLELLALEDEDLVQAIGAGAGWSCESDTRDSRREISAGRRAWRRFAATTTATRAPWWEIGHRGARARQQARRRHGCCT